MPANQSVWEQAPTGLYIGFASFSDGQIGQISDPSTNFDAAHDAYADMDDDQSIIVFHITHAERELALKDVTDQMHNRLMQICDNRRMEEPEPRDLLVLPDEFFCEVALWTDGGFGTRMEFSDLADLMDNVSLAERGWADFADMPQNRGLISTYLRFSKDEGGYRVNEISDIHAYLLDESEVSL